MEKDLEKADIPDGNVGLTASSSSNSLPQKLSNCQFGWKDISYSVETNNGKKQILENVSGCVEKGIIT